MLRARRLSLAAAMLGLGIIAAWLFRRDQPAPATADVRPQSTGASAPAIIHAEPATARLLDTVEPVALGADAGQLVPIGAGTTSPNSQNATRPGQFVSLSTDVPETNPAADGLPPELTREFPSSTEAAGSVHPVSQSGKDDTETSTTTVFHEVRDGDTLAQLARRYLGNSDQGPEIFEANRDVLTHPDILPLRTRLRIPVPRSAASDLLPKTDDIVPIKP